MSVGAMTAIAVVVLVVGVGAAIVAFTDDPPAPFRGATCIVAALAAALFLT